MRQVLEILWRCGESRVRDVVEKLDDVNLARHPNTVQTTLNMLCGMGLAKRVRVPGTRRRYLYSPQISREQLEKTAIREAVLTLLAGDQEPRQTLAELLDMVQEDQWSDLEDALEQARGEKTEPED